MTPSSSSAVRHTLLTLGLLSVFAFSATSFAARPGAGVVNPDPGASDSQSEQATDTSTPSQPSEAQPSGQSGQATNETAESPDSTAADSAGQDSQPAQASAGNDDKPYEGHVQCDNGECKIDLYLTWGYRAFSQCQVCHGLTGEGSTIGPSLVTKLQEIDKERFVDVVKNGYQGQIGVMPAWENNPNVMKRMDELYAYLKARSDGVIPGGRLPRFDR